MPVSLCNLAVAYSVVVDRVDSPVNFKRSSCCPAVYSVAVRAKLPEADLEPTAVFTHEQQHVPDRGRRKTGPKSVHCLRLLLAQRQVIGPARLLHEHQSGP